MNIFHLNKLSILSKLILELKKKSVDICSEVVRKVVAVLSLKVKW